MSTWVYKQKSGDFFDEKGNKVATGYSGTGTGRNNPDQEDKTNLGPIPRGLYKIGDAKNGTHMGPNAIELIPDTDLTDLHGRSGFYIHGDNSTNDASHGCIILGPNIRAKLNNGDKIKVEKE